MLLTLYITESLLGVQGKLGYGARSRTDRQYDDHSGKFVFPVNSCAKTNFQQFFFSSYFLALFFLSLLSSVEVLSPLRLCNYKFITTTTIIITTRTLGECRLPPKRIRPKDLLNFKNVMETCFSKDIGLSLIRFWWLDLFSMDASLLVEKRLVPSHCLRIFQKKILRSGQGWFQYFISSSLSTDATLVKCSWRSVQLILCEVANRQTNRQTDQRSTANFSWSLLPVTACLAHDLQNLISSSSPISVVCISVSFGSDSFIQRFMIYRVDDISTIFAAWLWHLDIWSHDLTNLMSFPRTDYMPTCV